MDPCYRTARLIACTALTLLFQAHGARSEELVEDFQSWNQIQARVDLDGVLPGLSTTMETTVRRGSPSDVDASTGASTEAPLTAIFVRPSLAFDVKPWLSTAIGYAWTPVYYDSDPKREIQEHRAWEQMTITEPVLGFDIQSRTRLEERVRTHGKGKGETELRLRQRIRTSHPLKLGSPWQVIASTEVFFFLNETDFESEPGFSENRGFVGVGYRLGSAAIEVGYLNQFIGGQGQARRMNHALSTSVSFSLDR